MNISEKKNTGISLEGIIDLGFSRRAWMSQVSTLVDLR